MNGVRMVRIRYLEIKMKGEQMGKTIGETEGSVETG